jgi:glycosyltransferase involved in cell wall biosynthesis
MAQPFPRVCFIAPNAYPLLSGRHDIPLIGGAELQVVLVARRLAARGRPISMVCLDFGQPEVTIVDGIEVFRAYAPDEGIPVVRFLWPRLTDIWSSLRRADADIYYQQTAGILTGIMAAFCRRHRKKSVFASASNPDLFSDTPRIQYARDRWIYSYGLRHVDRIFVQNDEQARLCRENFGREPVLVPNIYPMPSTPPVDLGEPIILWVSTIRGLKQPELFLDLVESLPEQQFRMIGGPGDGESALFDTIASRASQLRNLQFMGFLPFDEVEKHFDCARIFVNTSSSEGFPNAFLQAWSRGIPSVSFVDAGARLDGEEIGVRVATLNEMIMKVAALSADEALRSALGRRCADYVSRRHSPDEIVPLYERVFAEIMHPAPGSGPSRRAAQGASNHTQRRQ